MVAQHVNRHEGDVTIWRLLMQEATHHLGDAKQGSLGQPKRPVADVQACVPANSKCSKNISIGGKSSGSTTTKTARWSKKGDDLLCATRYALMMLRYAKTYLAA
jgi:hypothetical protein